eukprot:m.500089 g.500089  ORF g.500089 m.500089 type:complete len:980 (-) comp21830_c0_seq2:232-3171(-)
MLLILATVIVVIIFPRSEAKVPIKPLLVSAHKSSGTVFNFNSWALLGPFPVSKSELDGSPLEIPDNDVHGLESIVADFVLRGKRKTEKFRSEYGREGVVAWKTGKVRDGKLTVHYDSIEWQNLVNGIGGMEILEYQIIAASPFRIESTGLYQVYCSGLASFYVDGSGSAAKSIGPLSGNPYFGQYQIRNAIHLKKGTYLVRSRVRVKHQGQMACSIDSGTISQTIGAIKFAPDWIQDEGVMDSEGDVLISLELRNPFLHFIAPTVSVVGSPRMEINMRRSDLHDIAPSQSAYAIVALLTSSQTPCLEPFQLLVTLTHSTTGIEEYSETINVALRCRQRGQSILSTFVDEDASLQRVAVVHPPAGTCTGNTTTPRVSCPVLLTLHGTGISASDSADAFKVIEKGDSDYTFGFRQGWLLAPSRHGAHNWEGIGRRHALAAVRWLAATASPAEAADATRLIVCGHSMGGHGAWLFAATEPGRTMCLNANAGWNRKEQYGDSNTLFLHDLRLDAVDARLQYVLGAAVQENMVDRHARNLARGGVAVLARVGTQDATVHPWYTRRMARVVAAEGGAVELVEVAGKEHWWWDTVAPNDGGAVNDAALRTFFHACATAPADPRTFSRGETLEAVNPAAVGVSKHGLRLLQQHVPYQRSQIHTNVSRLPWLVTTTNVRRFSLSRVPRSPAAGAWDLVIDGTLITVDLRAHATVELCAQARAADASGEHWWVCLDTGEHPHDRRRPETYGPIRQVFESPYVIVYGTAADAADSAAIERTLQRHAVFVANLLHNTGDARAQVMPDTTDWATIDTAHSAGSEKKLNVVFIGGHRWNRWARKFINTTDVATTARLAPPLRVDAGAIELGPCRFQGKGHGLLALVPIVALVAGDAVDALGLLVDGVDMDGLRDVVELATPTIPPMVRQPYSNLLPDYVITSARVRSEGAGGIVAAGYWGNRWEFRPDVAYTSGCHHGVDGIAPHSTTPKDEL